MSNSPSQRPARPKKRKSGVPEIWKFEEAVFDLAALQSVFAGKALTPALQEKIDTLTLQVAEGQKKRRYRRQKPVNTISCGKETVVFFLKNPSLIPVMLSEQRKRNALSNAGEDMTYLELDTPDLYYHCKNMATWIYTQDESNGKDHSWNSDYRWIRTNYIYTMGRACRSADMALRTFKTYQQEMASAQPQKQPTPKPIPAPVPPNPPEPEDTAFEEREMYDAELQVLAKQKAAAQKRRESMQDKLLWAEQQRVAQLLRNKCNDDFEDEGTIQTRSSQSSAVSRKPRKITSQKKCVQPDLPGFDHTRS